MPSPLQHFFQSLDDKCEVIELCPRRARLLPISIPKVAGVSTSRVTAALAALALSLGVLPALAGPAAPAAGLDPDGGEKIRPKLERRLDANGAADFWVRFDERPDLSRAEALDDWSARGAAVVKALRDTAGASQADVRAQLDADGVEYQSFWATNAIYVPDGSAELAAELASEPSVAGLYPTRTYEVPELTPDQREQAAETVEWGIHNIKADQVWQQYGDTGAGHRRRQHRHRRAVRPPGIGRPVPRQQRRRDLHPRLQLVRRLGHLRRCAVRRARSRHPHDGHDGRRRRRRATRSVSHRARGGSRRTAAPPAPTRP